MGFHRSENLYRKENFQTIKEKTPKMEKKTLPNVHKSSGRLLIEC